MLDHVDHIHDIIDSTRRCCSWVYDLISKHCTNLVGSSFRNSQSKLILEKEDSYHSTFVAAMTLIEISSSDSDWDIEDGDETDITPVTGSVASSRVLPSWALPSNTNSRTTGHGGQSLGITSLNRAHTLNWSSPIANIRSQAKSQMHTGFSEDRASIRHVDRADDLKYFGENGNLSQPQNRTVNSQIATTSVRNYEKLSSQEALKRTLPPSLQPHATSTRTNNLVGTMGSSQIRDIRGSSSYPAGPSLLNSKGYARDHFGSNDDNGVVLYENSGSRILPTSLMQGRSSHTTQLASPSDPLYGPGVGEERVAGEDERLIYQAALEDLNQPKVEATLPDGLLSVSLLRHQRIALAWMLQKETRSLHCLGGILADDQGLGKTISMISLIQMQRDLESKSISKDQCNKNTEALNLDDDDDNGSAGLDNIKQTGESDDCKTVPEVSTSTQAFSKRRPAAGTLVVCPASVLRQWARELDEKVTEEAKLSVLVYHGGSRTKDPVKLANYDVVLTTYSIVTNEVPKQPLVDEDEFEERNGEKHGLSSEFSINKKRKKTSNVSRKGKKSRKGTESSIDSDCGPLARVGWFRVVLDEAQTIKNHRTQVARACCSLRAKRRWCLSGTPIQNTIDDLYSYFRFLRYDPYAVYKSFYHTIKIPISRNSLHGYKKLQAVLRAIMLRRTKGTLIDGEPIINLPPKSICLTKVDFSTEERAFYARLEADSRSQFKEYAAAGTVSQNYANILLMLLRLRQACDHPLLVKGYNSDSVGKVCTEMAKRLPRDVLTKLLELLETSFAICLVCSDPPEDPVVTRCGHVFCYQCVSDYLTGYDNFCPASNCKEQLGADVIFSKATLRSCIFGDVGSSSMNSQFTEKSIVLQSEYSSSKIRAVLKFLQLHCLSDSASSELHSSTGCNGESLPTAGPLKAIIFSQWTSMLDLVENSLNQFCIQYRRLDGTMTLVARDRAVKDFNTDPEITVMLMSLKAGNLGLNMVAACHVILLDLWWNPTTEDQAVDRAHRIGQTRPVKVTRFTIKDTVEDRILALQEEKRKMVASAFGEDQGGSSATRLTVDDLKYLFMV